MSFSALLWKDLRREARSKDALQAGVVLVATFFVLDLGESLRVFRRLAVTLTGAAL